MIRRSSTVALLMLALLGASLKARAGLAAEAVEIPTCIPAGVSDAAGTIGCLRTPEGGVVTTDAASGRTLWRRTVRDPDRGPSEPIP